MAELLSLPDKNFLSTVEKYQEERRKAGRDRLVNMGLKTAGVGLFGAGAVIASAWAITITAPIGFAVAAGAVVGGAALGVVGGFGKLRGKFRRKK